jgi:hypothetical protein
MSVHALIFVSVFIALLVGHYIGDFWLQTSRQATDKALKNWRGRLACARHAIALAITKAAILAITVIVTELHVSIAAVTLALVVDAVSHYWADRRTTLQKLADIFGKGGFYTLGKPRPGRDDNPVLGTGAHALDQAWHITWIWIAALIVAIA